MIAFRFLKTIRGGGVEGEYVFKDEEIYSCTCRLFLYLCFKKRKGGLYSFSSVCWSKGKIVVISFSGMTGHPLDFWCVVSARGPIMLILFTHVQLLHSVLARLDLSF